ncbi:MADS-box protein SOC1-like [Vicia villosa]|uniref:MADS-box protein SOC1-like n=1 Tax=Vicia villosa TaxID=3911 RepID=UPI00273B806A|nr:MADS-box protein SOC1-like [Vicia villosa]
MVRGKTQMKRIENATSRQVTFSKRRNGLMKKAFELSILCDAEVALVVFSPKGRLYEFASSRGSLVLLITDLLRVIFIFGTLCLLTVFRALKTHFERYRSHSRINNTPTTSESIENTQHLMEEAENMMKKIDLLETSKRKLLGEGLGTCSIEELQRIEQQLEKSITKIRAKKTQVFREQIQQLKEKEKALVAENVMLSKKYGNYSSKSAKNNEKENIGEGEAYAYQSSPSSDVVTESWLSRSRSRS